MIQAKRTCTASQQHVWEMGENRKIRLLWCCGESLSPSFLLAPLIGRTVPHQEATGGASRSWALRAGLQTLKERDDYCTRARSSAMGLSAMPNTRSVAASWEMPSAMRAYAASSDEVPTKPPVSTNPSTMQQSHQSVQIISVYPRQNTSIAQETGSRTLPTRYSIQPPRRPIHPGHHSRSFISLCFSSCFLFFSASILALIGSSWPGTLWKSEGLSPGFSECDR